MKSLADALADVRSKMGAAPTARIWLDSDSAFYMGAAAMAEQFAQGQGTVLQLIRDLAKIQTRNAQLLAERLRELNETQREASGLPGLEDF